MAKKILIYLLRNKHLREKSQEKISEFYETGEYNVTRKFRTSTSDQFRCAREERVWKIENNKYSECQY